MEDGVPACLADDKVGPLHHHNAGEERGVTGELDDLTLLVSLKHTYLNRYIYMTLSHLADAFIQSDLQMRTMELINNRAIQFKYYNKSQLA